MDKDNTQYIIIAMIVMMIFLMLLSACRTRRHYVTPAGVDIVLPHTHQDSLKGGAR